MRLPVELVDARRASGWLIFGHMVLANVVVLGIIWFIMQMLVVDVMGHGVHQLMNSFGARGRSASSFIPHNIYVGSSSIPEDAEHRGA